MTFEVGGGAGDLVGWKRTEEGTVGMEASEAARLVEARGKGNIDLGRLTRRGS